MSQKKKAKSQNSKNTPKKAKKQLISDRAWTIFLIVLFVVLLGLAFYAVLPEKAPETPKVEAPKFDELGENQYYFATIEVYDYGTIKVQLDHKEAPITVANFVKLAKNKLCCRVDALPSPKKYRIRSWANSKPTAMKTTYSTSVA